MIYVGVDLGGTNIKVAAVTPEGNILAEANRATEAQRGAEAVCDDIVLAMHEAVQAAGYTAADIAGLGVGCPGTINNETGFVQYSNNLHWRSFNMRGYLLAKTGLTAAMGNDANVAALGEVHAGSAKGAQSAVIITLGTGVGSGVVLDGKILTGYTGAASEIGHMVIKDGGWRCTCGRLGCFESYASATGLIRLTKEGIEQNPGSQMAKIAAERGVVDGRTSFDAMRLNDEAGAAVVAAYIHYLAVGIANIVNIFYPEIISLSGGISKEGETLLAPLREQVNQKVFGGMEGRCTRIEVCTLGHKAGVIGAARLAQGE
ncbi:MAG: ROK family protein [Oscillospiraceae bacterium]